VILVLAGAPLKFLHILAISGFFFS